MSAATTPTSMMDCPMMGSFSCFAAIYPPDSMNAEIPKASPENSPKQAAPTRQTATIAPTYKVSRMYPVSLSIPISRNKTFPEIIPLTSLSVQATLCMNKRMRGARFLMKSLTLREARPSGRRPRSRVVPLLSNSIPPFPKRASDLIRSAHGRVPRNLPPALRPSCRPTAGPSATSPGWPSTLPSKDSST